MAFHRDPKDPLARDAALRQKAPAAQRLPGGDCWRRRAATAQRSLPAASSGQSRPLRELRAGPDASFALHKQIGRRPLVRAKLLR